MASLGQKGLLHFVTCGSVDDGKSTLIGRMLYDAKLVFADQAQSIELEHVVGQAEEGHPDYALLLDGLAAEREQGITIDVAYRFFTTEARSFIVADCPGHDEYTRNMAVGASASDLAVILINATSGLSAQTFRHVRICSMVGIRHFCFAVNKMDLVAYSQEVFESIRADVQDLMSEYNYDSLAFIPTSATAGDNVTSASSRMAWYGGPSLLTFLEKVDIAPVKSDAGFTLPVQRVCRAEGGFRGYEGTVASGRVALGTVVRVLPSKTTSRVERILVAGQQANEALAGQAATIVLEDELDISRGCVIEHESEAEVGSFFSATLLWMDEDPLVEGKSYFFKLGCKTTPGIVYKIICRVDATTGERIPAHQIEKNEICKCEISLGQRVAWEAFSRNRTLGSMILIDRVTNTTAAAGVIEDKLVRSDNLTFHAMDITRELREQALHQRACTVWFTGLSGSGKSTLANEVERRLHASGVHTMLLDGDNVRLGLNRNLGFSEADRIENIRRVAEVAKLMNDAGLVVLTAFISPFVRDRRSAREIIGEERFVEIYVSTPLEECERRDTKGLYAKARSGDIPNFTGVSSPYEEPKYPTLVIDTSKEELESAVERIVSCVQNLSCGM